MKIKGTHRMEIHSVEVEDSDGMTWLYTRYGENMWMVSVRMNDEEVSRSNTEKLEKLYQEYINE